MTIVTRTGSPCEVWGDKREAGASPAQGRCCVRPDPRAKTATASDAWEGSPWFAMSRQPEDLPVVDCLGASDPGDRIDGRSCRGVMAESLVYSSSIVT